MVGGRSFVCGMTLLVVASSSLLIGCGDDASAADMSGASCFHSDAPGCCPNQDPVTGTPSGPCAPNGLTCIPGATDLTCACDAGAWRCSSSFHVRDMSRSD